MARDYSFNIKGTSGKGILLVHGLTGSPAEMAFVGKKLHRMGFSVFAPVLAGHCQTEAELLKTTYEDWLDSLHAALRLFQSQVDEIYMAGICVGGGLALYAAHQAGDLVKGVAIYSPTLNYDGWNVPFYYPWAKWGLPLTARIPLINRIGFGEAPPYGIKSDRIRNAVMSLPDGIDGTLPHFPMKALYQNYRLNAALVTSLPNIKIPTLLLHAREDDVSHPRNAEIIQARHGGNCRIEWLDDSYHMIHVDQERDKVAGSTASFFSMLVRGDHHVSA